MYRPTRTTFHLITITAMAAASSGCWDYTIAGHVEPVFQPGVAIRKANLEPPDYQGVSKTAVTFFEYHQFGQSTTAGLSGDAHGDTNVDTVVDGDLNAWWVNIGRQYTLDSPSPKVLILGSAFLSGYSITYDYAWLGTTPDYIRTSLGEFGMGIGIEMQVAIAPQVHYTIEAEGAIGLQTHRYMLETGFGYGIQKNVFLRSGWRWGELKVHTRGDQVGTGNLFSGPQYENGYIVQFLYSGVYFDLEFRF